MGLAAASMSAKGKNTLDQLDDTRYYNRKSKKWINLEVKFVLVEASFTVKIFTMAIAVHGRIFFRQVIKKCVDVEK